MYVPAYEKMCAQAHSDGIPIVTPAEDNEQSGRVLGTELPCSYSTTVCVAAIDRYYKQYINWPYGEHVNFIAPGVDIITAQRRDPTAPQAQLYTKESGTAFAAAHATAALAIFISWETIRSDANLAIKRLRQNAVHLNSYDFSMHSSIPIVKHSLSVHPYSGTFANI